MKKQIVAILAIIAVITTLFTVSALSNEVGYKLSPCDAIDLSLKTTAVTDFLNATNMTTVQVYNFKGYKGENTWKVQWTSSDSLLDVYVNVATGNIAGIEEQKNPIHSVQASETPRWHPVISFSMCYGATQPFTIKGEKWRVQYLSSTTYTARTMAEEDGISYSELRVAIYPKDETIDLVSLFRSSDIDCNRTQYMYRGAGKGSDNYYFNVTKAWNLDWWQILVEDYY
ncbi:hypothetical protein C4E22_00545 [ANME-1 cluster archaeon AG-394-G06]|nr:hypothetical protein [ANME-1 cluster archaeon AG-394-G06]